MKEKKPHSLGKGREEATVPCAVSSCSFPSALSSAPDPQMGLSSSSSKQNSTLPYFCLPHVPSLAASPPRPSLLWSCSHRGLPSTDLATSLTWLQTHQHLHSLLTKSKFLLIAQASGNLEVPPRPEYLPLSLGTLRDALLPLPGTPTLPTHFFLVLTPDEIRHKRLFNG